MPGAHSKPASKASAGLKWLAALVAAALSCGLSALAEWRLEQLVLAAHPDLPLPWSALRFWLVTGVVFLALGPLFVWMAGGGVSRAFGRLRAEGWRNGKRLILALAIAACAGGMGWILGIFAANVQANGLDWRYSFAGMAILAAIALGCYFWRAIQENAEWGYLICASAVGLILVAIMPAQPNASWDGAIHFNTANAISWGEAARYDEGDLISLDGVPYIKGFDGKFGNRPDFSFSATTETVQAIDEGQSAPSVYMAEGTLRHEGSTWIMPSAVGNLPAGMGLLFGRLLGLPNSGELVCARLFNLFTYVLLWFFGIRYLRSAKLVFAAVALIPTSIFQAANFSYDPWLIAMLGFATCRYVGELQRPEEPLDIGRAAAILVPIVLACLVKAIYFPVALGFWAMGRGKFLPERQGLRWVWRLALVLVALGLFASFALPFFSRGGEGFTDTRGGEDVNSETQLELVIGDPLVFVSAAGRTGLAIVEPDYLGQSVALLPYMPPSDFEGVMGLGYLAFVIAAALLLRSEEDRSYAAVRFKLLNLIGILGSYLLFAASLYIGFTAVGGTEVAGFQPKYLLPFYPAFFGIVLNFPGIASAMGTRVGRLLRQIFWVFLTLYFVAFIGLRFVVFFE